MFALRCKVIREVFNQTARTLRVVGAMLILSALLALTPCLISRVSAAETPRAVVLEIQGPINPAVSDYLKRGMARAITAKASLIILRMDTPGGLDHSMRDIIQLILASAIPVVSYVAPEGARAASAGTYILYASHVAAMSPATNLGAATPISIGGLPGTASPAEKKGKKDPETLATDDASTLKRKVINDASAYIKALAERQGRNADWAVQAVREAVSLSAEEALKLQVIDFVAADLKDLLRQLDGHRLMLDSGPHVISTKNMTVTRIPPSWRYELLAVIGDPNIAYFLLLLGFFGLLYEFSNPGVFLPGVAGAISLLLAFYAFQILPINYSGLALIILGLAFLISEAFIPSFGSLGIGGIVAMAIGSLILIDDESLRISLPVIITTTAVSAGLILLLVGRVLAIKKKKVRTGEEALIGMVGEAAADFSEEGRIWLLGESWLAKSTGNIAKGEKVKVTSRKGLKLTVESLKEEQ
ncbi:nodulation protein NfeD [Desulfopila sp. IMCC35006]|uniref:NfeD family protein n=1 Tax=Desulfopila sp. IMCC35006 TaxID=2569542 RepID=UPI0010ACCEF5|nr:nodulation protein NfeD [Desulfopila sp. IMCC35006]TKB24683.1 nodulation protein NfeD [Desulfopila sp. IMCC35006]